MKANFIKCHGSGNEFVMIDSLVHDLSDVSLSQLSCAVCDRETGIGADGVLLLVRNTEGLYGMRMFNPDGSEAEMCGNGIRCIARLAEEYIGEGEFTLTSGGKLYPTRRSEDIFPEIPTYGVEIGVRLWSDDFRMNASAKGNFIDRPIEALSEELRFTAINVGNPHIIAKVEKIDLGLLKELGEKVTTLREIFPRGVNISFVEMREPNSIFVTTYERGAGITPSCGTAMTSSATAMALMGLCDYGTPIKVVNRGGAVECICSQQGGLHTTLIGNATYICEGELSLDGTRFAFDIKHHFDDEAARYNAMLASLQNSTTL